MNKENIERREHKLPDGTTIFQRPYSLEPGFEVFAPETCCLFCGNCSDVFYDYDGPYLFVCNINVDTGDGAIGKCIHFKDSYFDVEKKNDELRNEYESCPELYDIRKRVCREICDGFAQALSHLEQYVDEHRDEFAQVKISMEDISELNGG